MGGEYQWYGVVACRLVLLSAAVPLGGRTRAPLNHLPRPGRQENKDKNPATEKQRQPRFEQVSVRAKPTWRSRMHNIGSPTKEDGGRLSPATGAGVESSTGAGVESSTGAGVVEPVEKARSGRGGRGEDGMKRQEGGATARREEGQRREEKRVGTRGLARAAQT